MGQKLIYDDIPRGYHGSKIWYCQINCMFDILGWGEPTEIGFRNGNNGDFNGRGEILGSSSTRFYYLN